jgi:PAS domain S-box-containing protein
MRNDIAYSLAQSNTPPPLNLNDRMLSQLNIARGQLRKEEALPSTLADALRPSKRAIVITEATEPFNIVSVNTAWEGLCGYTLQESRDKTLGSLLQGPDTDVRAATCLISQLLNGEEEAGMETTNYTKSNRAFRNRVRVGPIVDESNNVKYFVGVLQEVSSMNM